MRPGGRKRLVQAACSTAIGFLLAVILFSQGGLAGWEDKVWDMEARLFARPGAHTNEITLILVDQQSLVWAQTKLGVTWPWPRELYGVIVDACRRCNALAVGLDVLFTEPSIFGVDDDRKLGSAIKAMGRVAAGSVFPGQEESGGSRHWLVDTPNFSSRLAREEDTVGRSTLPQYPAATLPVEDVARTAAILCNVHQDPDQDGIYRALVPLVFFDRQPLPGLGLGVYLAAHPQAVMRWDARSLVVDDKIVPIDQHGRTLLRFRGPAGTFSTISAAALLESELSLRDGKVSTNQESIRNKLDKKYIFFGFSAPGLFDLRPVPVSGIFSGVEINATFLDNLLGNDFIAWSDKKTVVILMAVFILSAGICTACFSGAAPLAALSLLFLAIPFGMAAAGYLLGVRLVILPLESGLMVTLGLVVFTDYLQEGRQRRFIKHSFRHYLSPQVIEQLIENPDKLRLGGERKELSIFFSDLQGFTAISEGLPPEELTRLLNTYLSAMTDIILEECGTVDKYEGDAIIAFWNAPTEVHDHALRAVRTALRCQEKLAELRPQFKNRYGHDLYMRIGINSGPAVVGNLGSAVRFDYTMLGDAVNLAARLEGANKQFGTYLMISNTSREQLPKDFPCRELAMLQVVGRKEAVRVYEPMDPEQYRRRLALYQCFEEGREAFYQGRFQEALTILAPIVEEDQPAAHYCEKCREMLMLPLQNRWKGVWVLTSK